MVVGQNKETLAAKQTFPDTQHLPDGHLDKISRVQCCGQLKSGALRGTLHGTLPRERLNLKTGQYEPDPDKDAYTGVIVGARADEEGSLPMGSDR